MARVAGTWDLTVTSPQGENRASMTVTQSEATLEGTMATEMGTVQVTDGRITGQRVTFTVAVPISGQTTTIVFRGTVDGNRMSGTADLGAMGSATFTGERRP